MFNRELLLTIIKTLVFSKLFYCSSIWSNTLGKNICKLQSVQNFVMLLITGTKKFDHSTPALKELHLLPVKQYLCFHDAMLTFKCMTGCMQATLAIGLKLVSTL